MESSTSNISLNSQLPTRNIVKSEAILTLGCSNQSTYHGVGFRSPSVPLEIASRNEDIGANKK